MIFALEGFAHGFQTLADSTGVVYQMSHAFAPAAPGAGVRWNDPAFGIDWPLPNPVMNERDSTWPDFVL